MDDERIGSRLIKSLKGSLIVSVQAEASEPLGRPEHLLAMAETVIRGGARAIRAEGPENLRALRRRIELPIIGLWKRRYEGSEVYITPTLADCVAVAETGVALVATDATLRPRPNAETLAELVAGFRAASGALLMADVATVEEAVRAAELGFDLVGTTLSGYTADTLDRAQDGPDFELLENLRAALPPSLPVVCEGRVSSPEQARKALDLGAHCVVVGSAITRPAVITALFARAVTADREPAH